ncbi:hypothetical protein QJQ45_012923 [Haematococcus lacustris]|nr:hypothetical protein QJQ45_012923 [Haematococcus lacustris]
MVSSVSYRQQGGGEHDQDGARDKILMLLSMSMNTSLREGAAGFSGSGSIGSKGVPVKQMRWEACKQFPERVVLVHGFRTNRVSSARTNVVQGQAESFRWLYPVRSMAKRSRIRGLMRSTSTVIKRKFYDRDVTASAVRAVTIALPTATRYKYEQWRTCGLLQIIPSRAYSSEPASSQGAPASAADSPATTSVAIPSASPLQSLGKTVAQLTQSSPGQQYRKHLRPWRWYDDWDERQWQKQEILKQWDGSGYAHLKSIPHSMKKVDRILRLVRGLSYEEAMHQCRVRPHKAARYTQQVLEHAKRDAESKGISGSTLVVDRILVTKGSYTKYQGHKAKGQSTRLMHRTSHVEAVLRPLPSSVEYCGFIATAVPTLVQRQVPILQRRLDQHRRPQLQP